MNLNLAIDRAFLKTTIARVKFHFPAIDVTRATVSRIREGRYYWTVATNGAHYATYVSASSAVEARRGGWDDFLMSNGKEA
jgi:hypothetical protein